MGGLSSDHESRSGRECSIAISRSQMSAEQEIDFGARFNFGAHSADFLSTL